MAGIGEISAIVSLVAIAAQLSQEIVGIATRYKDAKAQIEAFGVEVGILGKILDQLDRAATRDSLRDDDEVQLLISEIVHECAKMFSQLASYSDKLCCGAKLTQTANLRARTKWMYRSKELEYYRARVDSMKLNVLLLTTMQNRGNQHSDATRLGHDSLSKDIQSLSAQNEMCITRLDRLEDEFAPRACHANDDPTCNQSIATFESARSVGFAYDSILDYYARRSDDRIELNDSKFDDWEPKKLLFNPSRMFGLNQERLHQEFAFDSEKLIEYITSDHHSLQTSGRGFQDVYALAESVILLQRRLVLENERAEDTQGLEIANRLRNLALVLKRILDFRPPIIDSHDFFKDCVMVFDPHIRLCAAAVTSVNDIIEKTTSKPFKGILNFRPINPNSYAFSPRPTDKARLRSYTTQLLGRSLVLSGSRNRTCKPQVWVIYDNTRSLQMRLIECQNLATRKLKLQFTEIGLSQTSNEAYEVDL